MLIKPVILCTLSAIISSFFTGSHASSLTESSFYNIVGRINLIVNFHTPGCAHCIALGPTYSNLAALVNGKKNANILVASVDCSVENHLCNKERITAFPTLKLYRKNDKIGTEYNGPRDLNSLVELLKKQMNLYPEEKTSETGDLNDAADNSDDDAFDLAIDHDSLLLNREEELPPHGPVSGLYELTDDTYKSFLSKGRHFVAFYAPWCGHCMILEPTYYKLAQSLQHDKSVSISRINCDVYQKICREYGVKGYPTLHWIVDGKVAGKYEGSRSLSSLKAYITSKTEEERELGEVIRPEDHVVHLSQSNFARTIAQGTTLVMFTAPWCSHCKRLSPTFDALATKIVHLDDIRVAKVDCFQFDELCNEIDGYPTLLLYQNGRRVIEFDGERTLDNLYMFLLSHSGGVKDEL